MGPGFHRYFFDAIFNQKVRSTVWLAVLGCSSWVCASDFQSARTTALGGAGHATPWYTDALYLNPAALSSLQTYALSAGYVSAPSGNPSSNFNLSAMDSDARLPVQFGAGYVRREGDTFLHFAASRAILDRVSFGVTSKFYSPIGGTGLTPDAALSFGAILTDLFRISVTLDNAFNRFVTVGGPARQLVFGTRTNLMGIFQLYIDPEWTNGQTNGTPAWGLEAGAELPFLEYFFYRVGGFKNANIPALGLPGDGLSTGLGIFFPLFSVDYALQDVLQPSAGVYQNFQLTLHF
jgi:hypothetical protein